MVITVNMVILLFIAHFFPSYMLEKRDLKKCSLSLFLLGLMVLKMYNKTRLIDDAAILTAATFAILTC